jgi:23S rRNA pseudouridine1911/1915/1917 synthase
MSAGFDVLHVDNHVLVVNKHAGIPMVADASGDESLQEAAKLWVKQKYDKPGAVFLGVVHRLDRPVSGVVVLARTSKSASRLTEAFRERTVEKVYWAVTQRAPEEPRGILEQWLLKDRTKNRVTVAAPESEGAKRAVTKYRVLKEAAGRCLLELEPTTGRSHQLRVACASMGVPLLGDLKYGAAEPLEDKSVALHARRLAFEHPTLRERVEFEAELPALGAWRF